jgi:hypothetical protein
LAIIREWPMWANCRLPVSVRTDLVRVQLGPKQNWRRTVRQIERSEWHCEATQEGRMHVITDIHWPGDDQWPDSLATTMLGEAVQPPHLQNKFMNP